MVQIINLTFPNKTAAEVGRELLGIDKDGGAWFGVMTVKDGEISITWYPVNEEMKG
jgi:hypothetical protein